MTKPFWPDAAGLPSRVKAVEDVNGAAVGVVLIAPFLEHTLVGISVGKQTP